MRTPWDRETHFPRLGYLYEHVRNERPDVRLGAEHNPALPRLLCVGGIAVLEIGNTQREAVTALAAAQALDAECRCDLAGLDRCLVIRQR